MNKLRNKKIRRFLATMLSAVMLFNTQPLSTYSAPADVMQETIETVEVVEEYEVAEVYIREQPITSSISIEQPIELEELPIIEKQPSSPLSEAEIDLLAIITMAEAEGESEYGKRLVIDTILNRVDSDEFPDDIYSVVYQRNQFEPTWNGRMERCYINEDIRQLVIEELANRTNYDVVFFRGGRFSSYGTPMFQEGNHYFSKL